MGTGARAAIRVVAELVDVHAALGGGVVAFDVVGDGGRGGLGGLLEGYGAVDGGVTAEDCNCCGGGVLAVMFVMVELFRHSKRPVLCLGL